MNFRSTSVQCKYAPNMAWDTPTLPKYPAVDLEFIFHGAPQTFIRKPKQGGRGDPMDEGLQHLQKRPGGEAIQRGVWPEPTPRGGVEWGWAGVNRPCPVLPLRVLRSGGSSTPQWGGLAAGSGGGPVPLVSEPGQGSLRGAATGERARKCPWTLGCVGIPWHPGDTFLPSTQPVLCRPL